MASHPDVGSRRKGIGASASLKALAYALLLGECLVILIPSIYGRAAPKLFGIPFYYWFQLLWILVAMVVTGIAYLLVDRAQRGRGDAAPNAAGAPRSEGEGRR